ncbi:MULTISPECIES: STAS domain-containing protein [Flavobacteriaceae]|uniref:STAS domain-containing protein n=1 Tax=Flavobacteriaceae TaxID=49546 RepID=UPI0010AE9CD8|nr:MULTISPECIES: STAS domain-containing protein [Flavobacteriaceae]NJB36306.1 hypothetical protein [Croceivirga sp. JEA036]TKD66562.1 hypothetical protein FBT53_01525 [Flavobacterium sp. ASW18X]
MAIEVLERGDLYEVRGSLNKENVGSARAYFNSLLETKEVLLISLEYLEELDQEAALFLENFYRAAASQNKVALFFGSHNDAVMATMKACKTAYILSADRY